VLMTIDYAFSTQATLPPQSSWAAIFGENVALSGESSSSDTLTAHSQPLQDPKCYSMPLKAT